MTGESVAGLSVVIWRVFSGLLKITWVETDFNSRFFREQGRVGRCGLVQTA